MFAYDLYSCEKVPSYTSFSKGHCDGLNCPNTHAHACMHVRMHRQSPITHKHAQTHKHP